MAQAWVYSSAKPSIIQNLKLVPQTVPESAPSKHVVVKVLNVSLNPGDLKLPLIPIVSWTIPKPASLGFDFCGIIQHLPSSYKSDARNLQIGQLVWGMNRTAASLGALKNYITVPIDCIYPVSTAGNVPVEHASALGVAAMTAYQSVVPYAKPGASVLVNGGSGGTGAFTIQIAKAMDMNVIVTCSPAGVDLCRSLGADEFIDYTKTSIAEAMEGRQIHLLVDCVGNDTSLHQKSAKFLAPDGQFVLIALMGEDLKGIISILSSAFRPAWLGGINRKWKMVFTGNAMKDFKDVTEVAAAGKIRVPIDKIFDWKDVPAAFEYVKAGRVKGKVLVKVADS